MSLRTPIAVIYNFLTIKIKIILEKINLESFNLSADNLLARKTCSNLH